MNLLFVCSRNQWRSPTAEAIYKTHQNLKVKSAGTESAAKIKLTSKMIVWADIIFVMEKKHKQRILEKFETEASAKRIIILEIEDEYKFMDPELINLITLQVESYLE